MKTLRIRKSSENRMFVVIFTVVIASSIGLMVPQSTETPNAEANAALLNPLSYSKAICGKASSDGYNQRRRPFLLAAKAYAATQPAVEDPNAPRVWPGLGATSFQITTSSPQAQFYFNQGLRLIYAFNHAEAINAFKWAQELDPECALCYWGEAFSLGPNINAPMDPASVKSAYQSSRRANQLAKNATDKERALTAALVKRYSKTPRTDRSSLDKAFGNAMLEVAQQYSDDDDIAALAAEALMDTQAWDYWDTNLRPKGSTDKIMALLETVLKRNSRHPAAIHLYIHMTEASNDPSKAEKYANGLGSLMPGAGHIVHMPSHTYYRVGRFEDSVEANLAAVEADEFFLSNGNASPLYQFGYYTHNIHFVLTSAHMGGDAETALQMAAKLDENLPLDMAKVAPWVQPIKAAPYFAYAHFENPEKVLALEDPGTEVPYLQAMRHYARGLAKLRRRDLSAVDEEIDAIADLEAEANFSELENGGVPAKDILKIAQRVLNARLSMEEGDMDMAISQYEDAVSLQDGLPYTEPPYWYYPIRQSLGAALLANDQPARAEKVFFQSLIEYPNNGWALFGLKQAYKDMNQGRSAKYIGGLYKKAWLGNKNTLTLEQL